MKNLAGTWGGGTGREEGKELCEHSRVETGSS